jgi:hypothetical protein
MGQGSCQKENQIVPKLFALELKKISQPRDFAPSGFPILRKKCPGGKSSHEIATKIVPAQK